MFSPKQLRVGAIIAGLFLLNGLFLTSYRYLEAVAVGDPATLGAILINEVGGSLSAALLFPGLLWAFHRVPLTRKTWGRWLAVQGVSLVAFSLLHTTANWAIRELLYPFFGYGASTYGILAVRYPMEFSNDILNYLKILGVLFAFEFYRNLRTREVELAEARFANLQLQLQPHFLFNALNAISAAVYEDPRVADEMISRLSEFLRMTLRHSASQQVPLSEELHFLDLYIRIMQTRFRERLSFKLDADPALHNALVPQLLLQPLVENSIRHGMNPSDLTISIGVEAQRRNGSLQISIRDHGAGLQQQAAGSDGIGLRNTAARLEHLYGNRQSFRFANAEGGGTLVTIELPCHAV